MLTKLKNWARGRYMSLLKTAPVHLRAEHYQKRFYGDSIGAVLTAFRIAARGDHRESEEDIFACYPANWFYDRQGFEEMLSRWDIISFDVFDTLLLRQVDKPTDVFFLIEKEKGIPGFAKDRESAERLAREQKYDAEGSFEVTIDDIYRMPVMETYGVPEKLIAIELATERRCCYANPVMSDFFSLLHAKGKTVVATSDMYFHAEQIRDLLENVGFSGIDALFVSGDNGTGKGSGGLFDVLREYADGRRIVHIGDNFESDVFPLRGGDIAPIHYLAGRKSQNGERG